MNYTRHIIRNFPKHYPWWKKIFANILFFFGGTVIHHRKNLLNNWDFLRATHRLKAGDIVLVGGLRRLSSIFIGNTVTHTLLYVGWRRFIHSIADGVEYAILHDIFCEYDTMVILRPKKISKEKMRKIIECAEAQIGKPYDFDFEIGGKKFYCSELIEFACHRAGFDCGIEPRPEKNREDIIRPLNFINDKLNVIMLSHNLRLRNGSLEFYSK